MKTYKTFEDIDNDLKRISLEREIAWEELKIHKAEFKQEMQPPQWVHFILVIAGKYGFLMLFKKFLKK